MQSQQTICEVSAPTPVLAMVMVVRVKVRGDDGVEDMLIVVVAMINID